MCGLCDNRAIFFYNWLLEVLFLVKQIRTAQIQQNKLCISYFHPYPCARNGLFKAIQKITPMDVSVSGTIDQISYLKTFRGVQSP